MKHLRTSYTDWSWGQARLPLEALLWLIGLTMLALMDPYQDHLFSLCPFSWLLENGCPGCGLGRGIAFLARGEWLASWEAHPLAVPAVLLLLWRSGKLLYIHLKHDHLLTKRRANGKYTTPDAGLGAGRNELCAKPGAGPE